MREVPNVEERMSNVERDVRDHAKTLSSMLETLRTLEQERIERKIVAAREEERDKALNERLTTIETAIKGIQGVGNKLVWIAATAVFGAFIAFIIKGGLSI